MEVIKIENLKSLRENAGYTQIEVSEKLGVVQSSLSQWEIGLCKPKYKHLSMLAKLYGCTIEDLIKAIQSNVGETDKDKPANNLA